MIALYLGIAAVVLSWTCSRKVQWLAVMLLILQIKCMTGQWP